jgi:hypothetical protein
MLERNKDWRTRRQILQSHSVCNWSHIYNRSSRNSFAPESAGGAQRVQTTEFEIPATVCYQSSISFEGWALCQSV